MYTSEYARVGMGYYDVCARGEEKSKEKEMTTRGGGERTRRRDER